MQGVTLTGPHRDDFSFNLNGIDMKSFASQGQQRMAIISLKSVFMLSNWLVVKQSADLSILSHLRVSLASLRAMWSLVTKSAGLWANCDSPMLAEIDVPENTKILIGEVENVDISVLSEYKAYPATYYLLIYNRIIKYSIF